MARDPLHPDAPADAAATDETPAGWWGPNSVMFGHPLAVALALETDAGGVPALIATVPVQIVTEADVLTIACDLGRFEPSSVEVETVGRYLVVRGRAPGTPDFSKAVPLPEDADLAHMRTTWRGGRLVISVLRKPAPAWQRLIDRLRAWFSDGLGRAA